MHIRQNRVSNRNKFEKREIIIVTESNWQFTEINELNTRKFVHRRRTKLRLKQRVIMRDFNFIYSVHQNKIDTNSTQNKYTGEKKKPIWNFLGGNSFSFYLYKSFRTFAANDTPICCLCKNIDDDEFLHRGEERWILLSHSESAQLNSMSTLSTFSDHNISNVFLKKILYRQLC